MCPTFGKCVNSPPRRTELTKDSFCRLHDALPQCNARPAHIAKGVKEKKTSLFAAQ